MKSPLCNTHGCVSLYLSRSLSLFLSLSLLPLLPLLALENLHRAGERERNASRAAQKATQQSNKIELNPSPMSVLGDVTQLAVLENEQKSKH